MTHLRGGNSLLNNPGAKERQVVDSIKKAYSIKKSNQKVDFSELVIIKEVLKYTEISVLRRWDDLDSSNKKEEETIDETSY